MSESRALTFFTIVTLGWVTVTVRFGDVAARPGLYAALPGGPARTSVSLHRKLAVLTIPNPVMFPGTSSTVPV